MNISKAEQRTLHALARGGAIVVERDGPGKVCAVNCVSREGWTLEDCTVAVFRKLKRRRLIASQNGGPYCITHEGRRAVRPQHDNRS